MHPLSAFLALTLGSLPSIGMSQTTQRVVPMLIFEDASCGAWVRSQSDTSARQVYLYWFRGFVSGYNHGSSSYQVPLDAMPNQETLALFIDKHCRENPLQPFISAAFTLVDAQRVKLVI